MRLRWFLDGSLHDAAYAGRSLVRNPGLLAAILLTLALGIGANAAVYSVVYTFLLQPPPYREPERLVVLFANMGAAGVPRASLAGPELADFQSASRTLESLAAIEPASAALTGQGEPEQLRVGRVTTNFFDVLGVSAIRGRTFLAEDGGGTASPAAILTWPLFQRRFGSDPSVLGRQVLLDGVSVTVVGVLPPEFRLQMRAGGLDGNWHLFQPFATDPARGHRLIRNHRVVARLADGVTLDEATHEVDAIRADLARRYPLYTIGNHTFYLTSLVSDSTQPIRPVLLALLGAVIVVLVAACVNVAGLLLARAAARRGEIATLVALGADRLRLTRQCLVEGLLIAGAGALAGLGTGLLVLRALVAFRPPGLDRLRDAAIETPVLVTIVVVAGVWGLLFALAPLTELRRLASTAGRDGARVVGPMRWRTRSLLVVAQIALGTVLIVSAGLLVRTMDALGQVDTGFDLDTRALTFRVNWPASRYPTRAEVNTFSRALEERLRALPGVRDVGSVSHLPFDTLQGLTGKYLFDVTSEDASNARAADIRAVSPDIMRTLGVELVEGRWFREGDDHQVEHVAIVDEQLAARAWPGESAVGRKLRVPLLIDRSVHAIWTTVVGVARHVRNRTPDVEGGEQVYVPFRQTFFNSMAYVVRTTSNPGRMETEVRRVVAGLDPRLPVYEVKPFEAYVTQASGTRRFTAMLVSSFAGLALLLAGVGLAGLVSYSVSSRRREFGVRMAIGATPATVRSMVLGEGLLLVVSGVVVGLIGAAAAAHTMRALLFGVGPADLASYGGAIVMLGLTGLAAGWWPARRAMRVDPVEALRSE